MLKKILFNSSSLSSFMTLYSLSFFFFFLSPSHFIFLVLTSLSFFSSSFFLQNFHLSIFFLFFFPIFSFLSLSLHLLYPFFFSPPRSLPLRSAIVVEFSLVVEFNLTDEVVAVEISDFDLPLFFFFLQLWIPCDCDYG